ncbi:hypothetical protein DXT76_10715 [Halobacillus trueperi]|uniref:Uncharacterized protein n=1 Tax=Halobacillus trueperi TaxID=156205 RepID=A0A3D8VPX6_9BACI|nr:hypothetical protein [Halobacillus trueperi]RDY70848.1 hypothetical protein DXT76_10715 [Halobacillus trueperi]
MKVRNVLTTSAITSMILLAACETEEVPQEVEAVKADETEEYNDKTYDRDGDVIEKATTASDPDSSEEKYESKYDKRLMIPEGYEGFTKTLENFELPQKGRLSEE